MALIVEKQARRRNLPGSDVFMRTQLAYKDDLSRDNFVVFLNREALKIFNLTVTFGQHNQLKAQAERVQQQLSDNTFDFENYQISEQHWRLLEYANLEFFYIATAFELHFKSWLLQKNYIVNIIDNIDPFKILRKEQLKRPINKIELFSLGDFYYDTIRQINILQWITENSLNFNTICNNPEYLNILNVSSDIIGMVEDYRNLRNQIHLPGNAYDTPNIRRIGENAIELIIDFINERIVENSNNLINKYDFNFRPLAKL